ncbi:MAG TPA: hypothetical protein VF894_08835, partial [Anaeromyxobacter sp.]
MAQKVSKTTTDHETIRRWAEERGGWPAEVEATAREGQTGIIRIDFPGYSGEGSLRRISWDEWFQKFDDAGLALVYEDETAGGQRSNFNKLVARETAAARAQGRRTSRRQEQGGRASARGGSRGARAGASARSRSGAGAARGGAGAKSRTSRTTGTSR